MTRISYGSVVTAHPLPLRDAYLGRLGLDAEPPSVDALYRLHRAHVERVPYETLWIHLGDQWDVTPTESVTRIATRNRGGYCFHLNGAFSELLGTLGYAVHRHVGGVHGPEGPDPGAMSNHLVLTVSDLPSHENPGGQWYVDAGLGDALHEPLPLLAGAYEQGPFRLALDETPGGVGDWHLTHDPLGSFPGMSWRSAPATMDAFAERNRWLSTAPESGFVKVLSAQRRDATGVDALSGLWLRRVGTDAYDTIVESRDDLVDVLRDRFGLDLEAMTHGSTEIDALWARAHRAHVAWEEAGRP
jgi:N-hydroxyarylamine O-acetyltransferase